MVQGQHSKAWKQKLTGPYLFHQHLHVVGAAPAVGFHDEAETESHRWYVHLGAGDQMVPSLASQDLTSPPQPRWDPEHQNI